MPISFRSIRNGGHGGIGAQTHRRTGYVLVESLVALVLLAGGAALLHLVAVTTAAGLDRAIQRDAAIVATDVSRNIWLRQACSSALPLAEDWPLAVGSRLAHQVDGATDGAFRMLVVRTSWTESPLADDGAPPAVRTHRASTGVRCD
ncbi:hypothetical protein [Gemmatimonas aurantiaca]|uniref:hypothetical protein n=1 Tax=Gemmatimonas aurantiaca TaxID=173480 RepID=UPI00301DFC1B